MNPEFRIKAVLNKFDTLILTLVNSINNYLNPNKNLNKKYQAKKTQVTSLFYK